MRRLLLLGLLVVFLAGCDAGGGVSFRFEVRDEASEEPIPGSLVRMFWFDDPDDVLGQGPVEEGAKRVGEERSHGASYGLTQRNWQETRTDPMGVGNMSVLTFYAGAGLLPIHNLVLGAREEDPTGVWIRVHPGGEPSLPYQDFLIMDGADGPELVGIRWEGRHPPEAGPPVGAVLRVQNEKGWPRACWRVVIPIER